MSRCCVFSSNIQLFLSRVLYCNRLQYKTLSWRCRLQLIRTRKLFVTLLLRSYLLGHCQCQVISLLLRNDLGPRSRSCSTLSRVIIVHLTRDHDNQLAVFTCHNSREIPLIHTLIRTTFTFLFCPYCTVNYIATEIDLVVPGLLKG